MKTFNFFIIKFLFSNNLSFFQDLILKAEPKVENRLIPEVSPEKIFKAVCFNNVKKYTALETEVRYLSFGKDTCPLVSTKIPFNTFYLSGGVQRGFKYKRSFDVGYN